MLAHPQQRGVPTLFYTNSIASTSSPRLTFPLKKERFPKSFRFFRKLFLYDRSLIKEQKSLNKYYCIDNGLRGVALMPQSNDNGKNLENTVFMQLNTECVSLRNKQYLLSRD